MRTNKTSHLSLWITGVTAVSKSSKGKVDGAVVALSKYIEWNKEHEAIAKKLNIEPPSKEDSDVDYWKAARAVAIKAKGEDCTEILPRVIRVHQLEDIHSSRRVDRQMNNLRTSFTIGALGDKRQLVLTLLFLAPVDWLSSLIL